MLFQRPGEKPVFYTSGLFQTGDGEMAKSRMGEEEASLNNKQKKKIQVKECDRGRGGVQEKNHHICLKYIQKSRFFFFRFRGHFGAIWCHFSKKDPIRGQPLKEGGIVDNMMFKLYLDDLCSSV